MFGASPFETPHLKWDRGHPGHWNTTHKNHHPQDKDRRTGRGTKRKQNRKKTHKQQRSTFGEQDMTMTSGGNVAPKY